MNNRSISTNIRELRDFKVLWALVATALDNRYLRFGLVAFGGHYAKPWFAYRQLAAMGIEMDVRKGER